MKKMSKEDFFHEVLHPAVDGNARKLADEFGFNYYEDSNCPFRKMLFSFAAKIEEEYRQVS